MWSWQDKKRWIVVVSFWIDWILDDFQSHYRDSDKHPIGQKVVDHMSLSMCFPVTFHHPMNRHPIMAWIITIVSIKRIGRGLIAPSLCFCSLNPLVYRKRHAIQRHNPKQLGLSCFVLGRGAYPILP
jgi:hypothetical protein